MFAARFVSVVTLTQDAQNEGDKLNRQFRFQTDTPWEIQWFLERIVKSWFARLGSKMIQ